MSEWKIIVTDMNGRHLDRIGEFSAATFSPRFDDVGTWAIAVSKWARGWDVIRPGNCIAAYLDNDADPVCAGPITMIDRHENDARPQPMFFVAGATDEIFLQDRYAWPNPAFSASAQGGILSAGISGNAGYCIEALFEEQCVISYTPRRIPNFDPTWTATLPGVGANINVTYIWDNLLDLLRGIGLNNGVGFKITRSRDTINGGYSFETWLTSDLSGTVVFSTDRGNLGDNQYSITSPKATAVIVGGDGPDAALTPRPFVEVNDVQALLDWGRRVEYFDDRRDTTNTTVMTQEGQATLLDQSAQYSLSGQLFDGVLTNGQSTTRFGIDYQLGDLVTVRIDGVNVVDRVSQVTYQLDENGVNHTLTPIVGSWQDSTNAPAIIKQVRDLARRVGLLERRF